MDTQTILARAQAYISEEKDAKFADEVRELVAKGDMKELA